ncbi:MAG: hypothetical protein JWO80_1507 [Bryobacterales bacterium]|nr:hypothetical protein [Bryobacterales bacterium]
MASPEAPWRYHAHLADVGVVVPKSGWRKRGRDLLERRLWPPERQKSELTSRSGGLLPDEPDNSDGTSTPPKRSKISASLTSSSPPAS